MGDIAVADHHTVTHSLLRIGPGIGGIGIDHTHGQTQFERIGETIPFAIVAAKRKVDLLQRFDGVVHKIPERCSRSIQFLEETGINLRLTVVRSDGHLSELRVRNRTVHIRDAVHGRNFKDLRHSPYVIRDFAVLVSRLKFLPCSQHLRVSHIERMVVPVEVIMQVIVDVAAGIEPDSRHISAENIAAKVT